MNKSNLPKSTEHDKFRTPIKVIKINHASSWKTDLRNIKRRANSKFFTLDIILLTVSILIILILTVSIAWFCLKRRRELNWLRRNVKCKVSDEQKSQKFPEIAIVRSRVHSSEDSIQSNAGDTASVVSSIWDSPSQRFDKTFLEEKIMNNSPMERIDEQLQVNNNIGVNRNKNVIEDMHKNESKNERATKYGSSRSFASTDRASF